MRNGKGGDADAPRSRQLEAWKLADQLAVQIFQVAKILLPNDRWLRNQILSAAESASANIAEGYGRASKKEFVQFLNVTHRSLYEVEYHLHFMERTNLVDSETCHKLTTACRRASKMIFGLMRTARSNLSSRDAQRRYLREEPGEYGF